MTYIEQDIEHVLVNMPIEISEQFKTAFKEKLWFSIIKNVVGNTLDSFTNHGLEISSCVFDADDQSFTLFIGGEDDIVHGRVNEDTNEFDLSWSTTSLKLDAFTEEDESNPEDKFSLSGGTYLEIGAGFASKLQISMFSILSAFLTGSCENNLLYN